MFLTYFLTLSQRLGKANFWQHSFHFYHKDMSVWLLLSLEKVSGGFY